MATAEALVNPSCCWLSVNLPWPSFNHRAVALLELLTVVGDQGVQVAILIDVAQCHVAAEPITQLLAAVAKSAAAVVQEYLVGFAIPVDDKGIQVAVAVQITQRHGRAIGADQVLVAVAELPLAVVQPDLVAGTLCKEDVEGFVAVQVSQSRARAGFETLVTQGEFPHTVVQPQRVGLILDAD